MRKEILVVIFAGILFGIFVAFGVWRANNALTKSPQSNSSVALTNKTIPSPTPNGSFPLTIAKPEENDVLIDEKVTISGITKPSTQIIISDENEDFQVNSNASGEFEQEIKLIGGVNQILIRVIPENGEYIEKYLNIIYSSEFAKELTKQ